MKDYRNKDFTVGFIGGGHICEAITRGIIISGYVDPGMIHVSTLEDKRRKDLHKRLGIRTDKNNTDLSSLVDILFISVRPLEVLDVCKEIAAHIKPSTLVVSLAAGISTDRITESLNGHKNLARIMPNLPAKAKASTTVVFPSPNLDKNYLKNLEDFLAAFGMVLKIEKEELMDPITVLSGSAPAYYIMIADALIQYGIKEGIPKDICTSLVLDTMEGSAQWAMHSKEDPSQLWPMVVTKGGVTAEGMDVFNKNRLIDIFIDGLKAATKKAKSINNS